MILWRDITLAVAALAAALFGASQWLAMPGYPAAAAFPLILVGVLWALPRLVQLPAFSLVAAVIFFSIVLDEKSYPFNDWDPFTETFGPLLFDNFSELLPVAGLRLTPFELLSFVLGLGFAFMQGRDEVGNLLGSERFRVLVLLSLLIPVTTVLALMLGQANGLSLSIAMTQVRTLPIMGLWTYIGYVVCQKPENVSTLFKVVVAGALFKALQGLYAYFVVFGGAMGRREFLIEHLTSEHFAIAMIAVAIVWYRKRRHVYHDLLAVSLIGLMFLPYLINERRASFIGVLLTLAFVPVIYWRKIRLKHVEWVAAGAVAFALFVGATWNASGPLGIFARTIQSFTRADEVEELDYRDVENFNHYAAIMEKPVTGQGFGSKLKNVIDLTDISSVYPLYDVLPHNNILWLWSNGGPLAMGAFGVTMAFAAAVFLRLARRAPVPLVAFLGFMGFGMVIRWLVYAYADLGFVFFRLTALLGLALGMGVRYLNRLEEGEGGKLEAA